MAIIHTVYTRAGRVRSARRRRRAEARNREGRRVHPSPRSGVHRHGKESYARCPRFPNGTYRLRERWRDCARAVAAAFAACMWLVKGRERDASGCNAGDRSIER